MLTYILQFYHVFINVPGYIQTHGSWSHYKWSFAHYSATTVLLFGAFANIAFFSLNGLWFLFIHIFVAADILLVDENYTISKLKWLVLYCSFPHDALNPCYTWIVTELNYIQGIMYKTAVSPVLTHWKYCSLALLKIDMTWIKGNISCSIDPPLGGPCQGLAGPCWEGATARAL